LQGFHIPKTSFPHAALARTEVEHAFIDTISSHDSDPFVLTRPLAERASSTEPQAKRQKAEGSDEASTVITRSSANLYSTLDDVLEDIDSAVSDIMKELGLSDDAVRNHQFTPLSHTQIEVSAKVSSFKKRAHDLAQKNKADNQKMAGMNGTVSLANGGLGSKAFTQINANPGENKAVLTLYGNTAGGPRQLFSSKQKLASVKGEVQDTTLPIQDAGLPNGITTTHIVPIDSCGVIEENKRVPTLGDLFPTPPTLPTLQPPKPSKVATTRSSTVGWYQPATADPSPKSSSYFKQSISTGQWLDYSNTSAVQDNKRKQRDRAMSLGGSKAPQLDIDAAESEAAKLEGLFRGAYSSFAPTKDDAAAIVPEGQLNRAWWQRFGEKSFQRLVENANELDGVAIDSTETGPAKIEDDVDEDEKFREAVEMFEKEAIDPSLGTTVEKSVEEKDVDEVLESISELLETLNSYQRIRHLSLNPTNRPMGLLSTTDTTTLGTPSKPSESELATYEVLKSQLALMIATLPPFAVAKLNSDQLAELSISTKIPIPMKEYNGVMEEDEASRTKLAGLAAPSTAPRAAQPVSLPRNNSAAFFGNQYSAQRPAGPIPQQYYGSQTPIRQPPNNYQRPPATAPAPYPLQRPASATPYRSAPYAAPAYAHQAPRPIPQQYNPPYPPQYPHTPGAQPYARPPTQPYQGMPQSTSQTPMNGRYPSQPSYPQQAPAQNGLGYPYGNGINANRQPSPQKPLYSPQPTPSQLQGRPSYSTPTPPTSQGTRPYLQNPLSQNSMMNGGSSQSPQPQHTQPALGPTNYSTFMTTAEQASMMERQRAQLAQQQGLQQQARNAAQAGAMGSPSKTQVNGNPVAAGL
jgi:hypothetical protein